MTAEMRRSPSPWGELVNRLFRILFANMGTKFMAVVLAALTWFLMYKMTVTTEELEYTVKIVPPPGAEVLKVSDIYSRAGLGNYVRVTLSGSASALAEARNQRIVQYAIAGEVSADRPITVIARDLDFHLNPGVDIVHVEPPTFTVRADKTIARRLTVKATTEGELAPGHSLAYEPLVVPDMVTVSGPESVLEKHHEIPTQPVNLAGRAESFEAERVALVDRLDGVKVVPAEPVTVTVSIRPETVTVPKSVTFEVQATPEFLSQYNVKLVSSYDPFSFRVPKAMAAQDLKVKAVLDLTDPKFAAPGEYPVVVRFDLPEGVTREGETVQTTVTIEAREDTEE